MRWWVVLVLVGGCDEVFSGRFGGGVDAPIVTSCDPQVTGPWGLPDPEVVPDAVNSLAHPSLSETLREVYFQTTVGTKFSIGVMTRSSSTGPWGNFHIVEELEGDGMIDSFPELSEDGLTLYFVRQTQSMDVAIWKARRDSTDDAWTLEGSIGKPSSAAIYFGFGFDRGATQFVFVQGAGELCTSDLVDSEWYPCQAIATARDIRAGSPSMTPDGLAITYQVTTNINMESSIYEVRRTSKQDPFGPRSVVIQAATTTAKNVDPWMSCDRHSLFFVDPMNRFVRVTR